MKHLFSFSILFLFFIQISFSQVTWEQCNGPYGGRIYSYASKGDILFVCAGGLYRSLDNGVTWQTTGFLGSTSAMQVFEGKIFAWNGWYLYISEDDGETWVKKESFELSVNEFYIYRDHLFAATFSGVYKYNHNDDSWENRSNGLPPDDLTGTPSVKSIISINNGTLFCIVNNALLYSSNDNGQTWSEVLGSSAIFSAIKDLAYFKGELFVFGWFQGNFRVRKSADWGDTWTELNVTSISASPYIWDVTESDGQLFMATDEGVISYDGTSNYFEQFNEKVFHTIYSNGSVLMASNEVGLYKWDVTKNDFLLSSAGINNLTTSGMCLFNQSLYCATTSGVYFSADKGLTWKAVAETVGILCSSVTKLDDMLFISSNEGVLATSSSNTSLRSLNFGLTSKVVRQILAVDNDLYAATDAGLFRSVDKGENWVHLDNYDSSLSFLANEGDLILAAANYYGVYKVSDDRTAVEIFPFKYYDQLNTLEIFDGTIFVSVTDYSGDGLESIDGLFRSVDGGETWMHSDLRLVSDMFKRGDSNLYAVSWYDNYYSPDNGLTWDSQTEEYNGGSITSILQGEDYMYVGTLEDGVYRRKYLSITEIESDEYTLGDGTISNIPDETTAEELLANIKKPYGSSIRFISEAGEGQDVGSLKSTGAGFVKGGDVVLVIAEDGVTEKRYVVQTPSSLQGPKNQSLAIFPNPASDKLYFSDATLSNARVQIFDVEGTILVDNLITDGFIDISSLPKGFYIAKIINDGNLTVNKFVKE